MITSVQLEEHMREQLLSRKLGMCRNWWESGECVVLLEPCRNCWRSAAVSLCRVLRSLKLFAPFVCHRVVLPAIHQWTGNNLTIATTTAFVVILHPSIAATWTPLLSVTLCALQAGHRTERDWHPAASTAAGAPFLRCTRSRGRDSTVTHHVLTLSTWPV
jgi:hypothetical protein